MIELLALPGWETPPRTLEEWVARLEDAAGGPVAVSRESSGVSWLEIGVLRLRGYAVVAGRHLEAINFTLEAPDPAPAVRVVEEAAKALGWDVHPDDPDDPDDDDDPAFGNGTTG